MKKSSERSIKQAEYSSPVRISAMRCVTAAFFAMLMVVSLFCFPITATSDNDLWITDNDDIITISAEISICEIAARVNQKYNFNISVVTVKSLNGSSSSEKADSFYDLRFTLNSDGMLLLICPNEQEYAISTSGSAIVEFEADSRLDNITRTVVERLSLGDYDGAGEMFARLIESCLEAIRPGDDGTTAIGNDNWQESYNDVIGDYWVHYKKPIEYNDISIGGISQAIGELPNDTYGYASAYLANCLKRLLAVLMISAIIAFIWVGVMRSGMNNVQKSNRAANYVRPNSFKLTQSADLYLYSTVTKSPRAQSSSGSNGNRGGGGSISHHSSSGGTHGGRSGKF